MKNPYSGLGKKIAGVVLEQLQKSPKESDLLDDLYYKLRKYGMLSTREARPSQQQSPLSGNESGNQAGRFKLHCREILKLNIEPLLRTCSWHPC